jgi:hypothetical protein
MADEKNIKLMVKFEKDVGHELSAKMVIHMREFWEKFAYNVKDKVKSFLPFTAVTFAASTGVGESILKLVSKGFFPLTCLLAFVWDYNSTKDLQKTTIMTAESLAWPIGMMGMKFVGVTNPWSLGAGNFTGLMWTIYTCLPDNY